MKLLHTLQVVALWQGGTMAEFEKISEFLKLHVKKDNTLTILVSAEDALTLEPEQVVICNKNYELPEMPLSNISISSFKGE